MTRGACTPAVASHSHCNAAHRDRPEYPINCVTWPQADAFCTARQARLLTEVEWEYAARGGEQYLKYPWGSDNPDGHACWKHGGGSCQTKAYPAGAFGLFDISGNVWEWTDDWYVAYPWPAETGYAKVYRGGSWSRRFEKWMHTRLRDRAKPSDQGAHLGFRCALVPDLNRCPFGKADDTHCLAGVTEQALQAAPGLERRSLCEAELATLPRGLRRAAGSRLRAQRAGSRPADRRRSRSQARAAHARSGIQRRLSREFRAAGARLPLLRRHPPGAKPGKR